MKDLIRKSKWDSLAGLDAKRNLRLKFTAIALLCLTAVFFLPLLCAAGVGTIFAAPLVLTLPADLQAKLTDDEKKSLQVVVDTLKQAFDATMAEKMNTAELNQKVTDELKSYLVTNGIDATKWKSFTTELEKLGLEIKELKEGNVDKPKYKTLKEQLKDFTTTETFKNNLKSRVTQDMYIDVKAASPFLSFDNPDEFPLVRRTID